MGEYVSLLSDYRISALELQEALIHNNAPRVLSLVLRQNELLQRIQMQCESDPGIRVEVSRVLSGLSEEMNQNERLIAQISEAFNSSVKEIARIQAHNNGSQRRQV